VAAIFFALVTIPTALVDGYLPYLIVTTIAGFGIAPMFIQVNAVIAERAGGSARSGAFALIGGGVVFGPKPRDYSKKINAKVKALAFSRALFDRAVAGEIAVIEKFIAETGKTKGVNQILGRIAPAGKVLLVDAPFALGTTRAARNIERVYLQEAAKLNSVDLAKYKKIIVSTKALETIIARINGGKN
jgi:large subunit ribosomal protein L4